MSPTSHPDREEGLSRFLQDRLHALELPWNGLAPGPTRAVVGLDGSTASRTALAWAASLASRLDLVAALGQDTPAFLEAGGDDTLEAWHERARRGARRVLDEARADLDPETAVVEHFPEDRAARALLRIADEREADLLAIGHGQHSMLERLVLGSVAEAVVHRTGRPVLVARDEGPGPGPVVVGVGDDDGTTVAAGWAARLAAHRGAELVAARASPEGYVPATFQAEGDDVDARAVGVEGAPEQALAELAGRLEASVLVVGHGREPAWLGSTAIAMLRRAPCAVLVVRPWTDEATS